MTHHVRGGSTTQHEGMGGVQFSSVQFSSVQFSSVQFSSVQFSSVQFRTASWSWDLLYFKGWRLPVAGW